MDAKELQAHILNNYGRSILDMDFTELFKALVDIEQEMINRSQHAEYLEMLELDQMRIDLAIAEEFQIEIDADLQREIDEYQQMTEDDREFPI